MSLFISLSQCVHLHFFLVFPFFAFKWIPHGVVDNVLDCDIVVFSLSLSRKFFFCVFSSLICIFFSSSPSFLFFFSSLKLLPSSLSLTFYFLVSLTIHELMMTFMIISLKIALILNGGFSINGRVKWRMVSLFNGISTFVGYLMPKPSLYRNSSEST